MRNKHKIRCWLSVSLAMPAAAFAQSPIDIGVVLDGQYKSHTSALSEVEKGFSLGHSELTLSAPIDDKFLGRLAAVLHDHDGATELELEEGYVQTTSMPLGFSVTGGRFLSQVGYLNGRHTHEDSFAERPAVYQAMLGGHYFDDGVRLNLLLPTPLYWRVGAEAFNGARLAGIEHEKEAGVFTLNTKVGADIGRDHSWQAGLSLLKNRLTELPVHEEDEEDEAAHDHDHEGHSHSAAFTAENVYIADLVWKWAPDGNPKERQLTLSSEYFLGENINEYAFADEKQEGWYASAVLRLAPQWSAGARYGRVSLLEAHDDHFHPYSLEESQWSLAWSNSHFSNVRLTYSKQTSDDTAAVHDALTLQYTMILGAHTAHEF